MPLKNWCTRCKTITDTKIEEKKITSFYNSHKVSYKGFICTCAACGYAVHDDSYKRANLDAAESQYRRYLKKLAKEKEYSGASEGATLQTS